ncbi:MAG: hypothetical protein J7K35_01385, partial [Syntrophobacterales bacterium]|nr:hypothetical protein [Syntrophobacterales bacterium]
MVKIFKRIFVCISVVLFVALIHTALWAQEGNIDSVQFKDGTVITGVIVKINNEIIRIKTSNGEIVTRKFDDIVAVLDNNETKDSRVQATPKLFTEVGLSTKYINGNSTYHISFNDAWENGGHGESELEFPYDNLMTGITLAVGSKYREKPKQIRG